MSQSSYVWGIDIGKCSLKALRCRLAPGDPRKLIAEAYDCIEYPMMLSQPDADPQELVRAALAEFMSRNQVAGDRVAVSAPGQAGLAKFIKLPPLEAKKIPDIVKYEANQQIPFPLDQVVWDWQRLGTGIEEGGFVMDAEVALFAMKREQVAKALAPFDVAGIDVEILQLTPIALANMVIFDQLPDISTINPDEPPPSIVLVSMGVDSTDLVVTNGIRVWQRSMPIGGGSFTKAILQDLQYTFAKAEKEKRNAIRASDPKAVFKAMRPVFNQFAAELQRSLNYYTGSDRAAKIGKVYLIGNAAKLRGLSDFVAKQLQLEVHRLEKFGSLDGPVLAASAFRDNRMGFGTCYGLALQAAGVAAIRTNLLPREIALERLVAAKKPWMVAALVSLLVAGLLNFSGWFVAAASYRPETYQSAFAASDATKQRSAAAKEAFDLAAERLQTTAAWDRYLIDVHERRFQSLDLVRAVAELLPRDPEGTVPEHPADRNEIHVDSFDMEFVPNLALWFKGVDRDWKKTLAAAGKKPATSPAARGPAAGDDGTEPVPPGAEGMPPESEPGQPAVPVGPTGPGWVVQIIGHHYHNEDRHKPKEGEQFVRETLVRGLLGDGDKVTVSAGPKAGQRVSVAELGIGYPVIVQKTPVIKVRIQSTQQPMAGGMEGMADGTTAENPGIELRQYSFVLQFVWQPTVPGGSPKTTPAAQPAAEFGP